MGRDDPVVHPVMTSITVGRDIHNTDSKEEEPARGRPNSICPSPQCSIITVSDDMVQFLTAGPDAIASPHLIVQRSLANNTSRDNKRAFAVTTLQQQHAKSNSEATPMTRQKVSITRAAPKTTDNVEVNEKSVVSQRHSHHGSTSGRVPVAPLPSRPLIIAPYPMAAIGNMSLGSAVKPLKFDELASMLKAYARSAVIAAPLIAMLRTLQRNDAVTLWPTVMLTPAERVLMDQHLGYLQIQEGPFKQLDTMLRQLGDVLMHRDEDCHVQCRQVLQKGWTRYKSVVAHIGNVPEPPFGSPGNRHQLLEKFQELVLASNKAIESHAAAAKSMAANTLHHINADMQFITQLMEQAMMAYNNVAAVTESILAWRRKKVNALAKRPLHGTATKLHTGQMEEEDADAVDTVEATRLDTHQLVSLDIQRLMDDWNAFVSAIRDTLVASHLGWSSPPLHFRRHSAASPNTATRQLYDKDTLHVLRRILDQDDATWESLSASLSSASDMATLRATIAAIDDSMIHKATADADGSSSPPTLHGHFSMLETELQQRQRRLQAIISWLNHQEQSLQSKFDLLLHIHANNQSSSSSSQHALQAGDGHRASLMDYVSGLSFVRHVARIATQLLQRFSDMTEFIESTHLADELVQSNMSTTSTTVVNEACMLRLYSNLRTWLSRQEQALDSTEKSFQKTLTQLMHQDQHSMKQQLAVAASKERDKLKEITQLLLIEVFKSPQYVPVMPFMTAPTTAAGATVDPKPLALMTTTNAANEPVTTMLDPHDKAWVDKVKTLFAQFCTTVLELGKHRRTCVQSATHVCSVRDAQKLWRIMQSFVIPPFIISGERGSSAAIRWLDIFSVQHLPRPTMLQTTYPSTMGDRGGAKAW